jgi:hypothetical protein
LYVKKERKKKGKKKERNNDSNKERKIVRKIEGKRKKSCLNVTNLRTKKQNKERTIHT